jgi:SdiA-regulated protein
MTSTPRGRRLGGAALAAGVLLAVGVPLAYGCRERPAASAASDDSGEASAAATAGAAPRGEVARYRLSGAPARQVALPEELQEISGLAVASDGRLFAHGDEEATVFQIDPATGQVLGRFRLAPTGQEPELGKKARKGRVAGDFEDMVIVEERYFLVTSNGFLLEFAEGEDGASVPYTAHATGLGERCEVEGLTYDAGAGELLLLCKEFHVKAERGRVAVYGWSIADRRLEPTPRLAVPYAALRPLIGTGAFNGSALGFTPGGRSVVVVAGPQRLFVEVTADGRVVEGGPLDRAAVEQPEGIAFLRDGTLLISSEGGRGTATLNAYARR